MDTRGQGRRAADALRAPAGQASRSATVGAIPISDREFDQFQALLRRLAGIHLSPAKKALVCGRLAKRVKHHGLAGYGDYYRLITSGQDPHELQVAVDMLTTNETYFFREPKHFDFLRDRILATRRPGTAFRVWSAACSSGEEAYSIAMVLADRLGDAAWEVVASDISTRMLERARNIPAAYLRSYCLKGVGANDGTLMIDRRLRERVSFRQINLNERLPQLGEFDLVFLRNVMIYFELDTKRRVVERLVSAIRPGGHLFVGHSESLNGICDTLRPVMPSIYRKE